MNPAIALALAAIVVIASLRLVQRARQQAWRGWRIAALLLGQALSAVLLYHVLLPPPESVVAGSLVVLTESATIPTTGPGDHVVALPEAGQPANVERVPDLGTALRRHPGASPVRVIGAGLVPRDRDAARGLDLRFEASPLPPGVVELDAPTHVQRGRRFTLHGRVQAAAASAVDAEAQGSLDLLDPAGRRVDRALPDRAGRFALSGVAGPAGRVDYRLEHRDAANELLESIALPVQVEDGAPLRIAMLSGGASPELKYLRRWALDAGFRLHSQISLGGGVEIGDPPIAMNAATLREFDLLVLDERAWRNLGDAGRAALDDATQAGLGVLLRITGELSAAESTRLREAGFVLETADIPRSVRLPATGRAEHASSSTAATTDSAEADATDAAPLLTRRPIRVSAADGAVLLRDDAGEALAVWRARGRGRIAIWTLSDSFRLVLSGRAAAYGDAWGHAFERLARTRGGRSPTLPTNVRVAERSEACAMPAQSQLSGPDGNAIALIADAAGCAAFWPTAAGWYELRSGDQAWAFPVHGIDRAPGLLAAERREATRALAAAAAPVDARADDIAGRRWPWALAWLLLSAALWWLERARLGRR